jgi:hypothetical protein
VRRSAKIGYKAFVRTGRLSSINQAASGALCCWGGGVDLRLKIMKTWPDLVGVSNFSVFYFERKKG